LVYFMATGIFYGYLVYFVVIWYIFPHFGILTKKNLATLLEWSVFLFQESEPSSSANPHYKTQLCKTFVDSNL
jgi:hypothetical protein